jgi:hypothetical protein
MSESEASVILIDDSRMTVQIVVSLTDDNSVIIYDCNVFLVQATLVLDATKVINLFKVLHGEQYTEVLNPIPTSGVLVAAYNFSSLSLTLLQTKLECFKQASIFSQV